MPIIAKRNYDSDETLFRVLDSNDNGEVQDFVKFLRDNKNRRLRIKFREIFTGKMDKSFQEILNDKNIKNFSEQKEKYNQKEAQNILDSVREVKVLLKQEVEKAQAETESLKEASRNESNSVRVSDEVERFKGFLKKPLKADSADFKDCVFATVKGLDESAFRVFLTESLRKESLADLTAMAKNLREKTIHATSFIEAQKEVLIKGIVDLAEQQKELSELAKEVSSLKEKSAELQAQAETAGLKAELPQNDFQETQDNHKENELPQSAQNQEAQEAEKKAQEAHEKEMAEVSSKMDSTARMNESLKKDLAEMNDEFANANKQSNEVETKETNESNEQENLRTM